MNEAVRNVNQGYEVTELGGRPSFKLSAAAEEQVSSEGPVLFL